jgi:Dephospho-CoA kinase
MRVPSSCAATASMLCASIPCAGSMLERVAVLVRLHAVAASQSCACLPASTPPHRARAPHLQQARAGAALAVLDVPLLFETGLDTSVDAVLVVTAPLAVQRARVLGRSGMTGEKLASLLAKQAPPPPPRRPRSTRPPLSACRVPEWCLQDATLPHKSQQLLFAARCRRRSFAGIMQARGVGAHRAAMQAAR